MLPPVLQSNCLHSIIIATLKILLFFDVYQFYYNVPHWKPHWVESLRALYKLLLLPRSGKFSAIIHF